MSAAPVIHWIRPGVGYAPAAAASMRRLEAHLGRRHDCNSSYRDWDKQMGYYRAWNAYANGTGPRPPHSRAIHPKYSKHCQGLADDSDDWTTPGYIALAAEHGWIRTAASDPTERHHFEYQWQRDQHRNDTPTPTQPAPAPEEEDDTMKHLRGLKLADNRLVVVNFADHTYWVATDTQWNLLRANGLELVEGPQPNSTVDGFRKV